MNRKTLLFLFLALVFSPFAVLAQSLTVTGKVVSSDDGYGLPGVTIQVKGTSAGTVTDMDGNYKLAADNNGTLVFSFVGYKTKEVAIKGVMPPRKSEEISSPSRARAASSAP